MPARPSVPALLSTLRTRQATSPALIWYGPSGERIELSGKVLDNWVAKTSNLLVDELDAEPGIRIRLDLPAHWKTLVWALAAWQTGCTVQLGEPAHPGDAAADVAVSDVTVTASQELLDAAGGTVVAVAQGALELRWPGDLPAGAVDYAAEVRSYADTYLSGEEAEEGYTALHSFLGEGLNLSYGQLAEAADGGTRQTLLIPASVDLPSVLTAALRTWAAGGTIVLAASEVEVTERLLAAERITARLQA
ncbi:TIGR03089 family protein [Arthrobacter sp. zg-ZUI100]|uniref:TIGR03089 family protein n=1 Tax=Arthrobacter jiangjiafuii TaxID=2817475 RepID=UPI001AEDDD1F|nr:TIGR03089 family protein [Arthrobacter jiangjiafuii]MBP3037216.1 TIGR03089 family protein [Arthrobacter jiangjiafuii]